MTTTSFAGLNKLVKKLESRSSRQNIGFNKKTRVLKSPSKLQPPDNCPKWAISKPALPSLPSTSTSQLASCSQTPPVSTEHSVARLVSRSASPINHSYSKSPSCSQSSRMSTPSSGYRSVSCSQASPANTPSFNSRSSAHHSSRLESLDDHLLPCQELKSDTLPSDSDSGTSISSYSYTSETD